MRAVVFENIGSVRVAEVDDPAPKDPTDAVVRVSHAAICGSDLHFLHGKAPIDPGHVMGHEAVGTVAAIGEGVTRSRVGQRVVVSFSIACGACWFCSRGQTQLCEDWRNLGAGTFGGDLAGAQAELVRVPFADVNLLEVPDDVDDEHALFVGDILTTGVYAASLADIRPDQAVAVLGVGPLGFFCVQAALAAGATVYALDRDEARLDLAASTGAIPIHVGRRHPVSTLQDATRGRGADVVIEAVGSAPAFESALDIVRRGGIVVVTGVYAGETVPLQLGVCWARAITLRFAGICPVHAWWERAMDLVARGAIDPIPLISHRLPLTEAPSGYDLFDRREATKVVLIP